MNPKRVPQMADAEAVLAALGRAGRRASYIGLVLNRKGLRARPGRRLHRSRHGDRRQRKLQPAQPGLQRRRGHRRLARDRDAGARRRHPRADHDLDRVRLPLRRRSAGRPRARDSRSASPRASPTRSPSPTRSASPCRRRSPSVIGALRACAAAREAARALPQHAQHRTRQRLRGGRGRRARARRELRRHRRLPVRARGHRQHPDRRPRLHAAAHGRRHRRRSAGAARHQPLAAGSSHPVPGMLVKAGLSRRCASSARIASRRPSSDSQGERKWRSRLATRCPRARSR